ncbi:diacylglycerol O-acyltransferase 2-like isoform 1-T2 [Mantella aurantiaca]
MEPIQEREERLKHNGLYTELMQILSVLQWMSAFVIVGPVLSLLMIWIVYSQLWILIAMYIIWTIFDWKTPERGGRRSIWIRWTMWKHFRDYFPIKLHKTIDLDPGHNYIFACHPHGILAFGVYCNFGTEATGFSQLFPNLKPYLTTLAGNFNVPLFRDYVLATGMCSVNNGSIDYLLSSHGSGNIVVIVVGGAAEALQCTKNKNVLTLKKRKGFIKKALTNGAFLVPVYSFGENDVLRQYHFEPGSWKRSLQELFQQWIGFAPCIFYGQGFFSTSSKGIMPLRRAINTVVGKPIPVPRTKNPSMEQVDEYHTLYINCLQELFNANKERFGLQQTDSLLLV